MEKKDMFDGLSTSLSGKPLASLNTVPGGIAMASGLFSFPANNNLF
jgi:hypothetical protein